MDIKLKQAKDSFQNLEKAFLFLKESIAEPDYNYRMKRNSIIQSFEFAIELFWKTYKKFMLYGEIKEDLLRFPRDVIEQAYQGKLIDNFNIWIAMLKARNMISHIYDEEQIDKIYKDIVESYFPEMQKAFEILKKDINRPPAK